MKDNGLSAYSECYALLESVLDSLRIAIFLLNSDFEVLWINKCTEKFFGLKRRDVLGKNKKKLVSEYISTLFEHGNEFKKRVLATYEDNTYVENFQCHILPREGIRERWLEHWSHPILQGPYAGGRIEQYLDITLLKIALQELEIYRIKGR